LVKDVGLVGRDDGNPKCSTEAGREDKEPHKRSHERRKKTAPLMKKAQSLAPDHTAQADPVAQEALIALALGGREQCSINSHLALLPAWQERKTDKSPKGLQKIFRAKACNHLFSASAGKDAPLVQHHDLIAGIDFVDQVGRPKNP